MQDLHPSLAAGPPSLQAHGKHPCRLQVVAVSAASFNDQTPEARSGALLRESVAPGVVDVAACPVRQELLVLAAGGVLQRWAFSDAGCTLAVRWAARHLQRTCCSCASCVKFHGCAPVT
jgi:hypothetical protein